MGVIYVAFEGFEVIAQAGDETIDARRNVPKAMLYSVAIVTVTYVLVALAAVVAFDEPGGAVAWFGANEAQPIRGFTGSVERLIPAFGGLLVTLAIIASSTSALNATIFSATRACFALGRDGMLPPVFARISPTRKTPYVALAFTAVIVMITAAGLNEHHGAATASIMFLFLFFVVNLCVVKVRRHMGDEMVYGYVMPLFPLFPIAAIVAQAALAGGIMRESLVAWVIGPAWVLGGVLVYRFYSRSRVPPAEHEIQILEEDAAPPGEGFRIMVSLANPQNALEMVQNTYKLCGAKDARVELLHMVPVPAQVPLADAEKYMLEGKEGILETMLYLAPLFPISTHLRYCRNVARGILSAVRDKRINMLIMGWHGETKAHAFKLGSTIDPIIERCPCDVVVFKDCGGNRTFKRVLVPLAGGPNGALALEVASILADPAEGEITVMTVAGKGHAFNVQAFVNDNITRMHLPASRVRAHEVEGGDVVEAILAEAEGYDMVVLGCTQKPMLRQIMHETVPETVAARCDRPLVMVRSGGRLRSWVRRWI